jgi:hypothetical protein
MLLAYIDESHDRSTYWLIGLVCPEDTIASLTRALDAVVQKAAGAYPGVSPQAELHGHDLFQGKGAWSALEKMPRARIGVYIDTTGSRCSSLPTRSIALTYIEGTCGGSNVSPRLGTVPAS